MSCARRGGLSRRSSSQKRDTNANSETCSEGKFCACAGRRPSAGGSGTAGAILRRAREESVRGKQRTAAGTFAGGLAAPGVSVFVRIGIDAAPRSAADQAGTPILARLAIFVVERARSELAFAVRAEAGGWQFDRRKTIPKQDRAGQPKRTSVLARFNRGRRQVKAKLASATAPTIMTPRQLPPGLRTRSTMRRQVCVRRPNPDTEATWTSKTRAWQCRT